MNEVDDLLAYLDASPSPYHAVASSSDVLRSAGFTELHEHDTWAGVGRGFVRRGGALVAWRCVAADPATPFRIVGAHTDSPGLRIKPHAETATLGWRQLAVEVYGGALLNSWLDRDLGIAGRFVGADGVATLVEHREPIARVPQLAIHLDRDVNERGLVLDRQLHLSPIWGTGGAERGDLAEHLGIPPDAVSDLCLFDLTPARLIGADRSLVASARIDNQVSCWAATTAIAGGADAPGHVAAIALFDHEEVGSESSTGASGPLLEHVLERLVLARGGHREHLLRALAGSTCISADNAHAVHPNYPERHDPGHRPLVNHGPALKVNANQRYATSAESASVFLRACQAAGVPWQTFVSRNNVPCGTTIGPITATRLGIATVDVGVPQLSMHSARELCGAEDPLHLTAALDAFLAGA